MKFAPRSLAVRLVIALLVAAAGIALLDHFVFLRDAKAAARAMAGRGANPDAAPIVGLRPVAGDILLALQIEAVPADAAPVVQVLADGGFVVLREATAAKVLANAALGSAAILLPTPLPGRLDPRARATLVEVIARLAAERPVRASRFRTMSFRLEVAQLERLLGWVP